jgi:Family of unknown function (DUF6011)
MSTYTVNPASPAQVKYIADLLAKKSVPANVAAEIKTAQEINTRQASAWIDLLKSYPAVPTAPAAAPVDRFAEYRAAFEEVPNSKWAIPTAVLAAAFPNLALRGDLLFLETKTYMGKRYLARLTGAPGRFSRSRIPLTEATGLLRLMAGKHVEFSTLFAKHYGVCGRCGAELTDPVSRAALFGPECRKVFGIK